MKVLILPLAALLAGACATTSSSWSDRDLRLAEDTPSAFNTEDGTPVGATECRSPLVDPRDQTLIRMLRSGAIGGHQRGDYEVPPGRYGVGQGELLRIDCATGQAVGIVRNR